MTGIEMRLNGRKITSAAQLQRELALSLEKIAAPGVQIKKTRDGYTFEGTPEQIKKRIS